MYKTSNHISVFLIRAVSNLFEMSQSIFICCHCLIHLLQSGIKRSFSHLKLSVLWYFWVKYRSTESVILLIVHSLYAGEHTTSHCCTGSITIKDKTINHRPLPLYFNLLDLSICASLMKTVSSNTWGKTNTCSASET